MSVKENVLTPDTHKLVNIIVTELKKILSWFRKQNRLWFRNSSILIIYNSEHFRQSNTKFTDGSPNEHEHIKASCGNIDESLATAEIKHSISSSTADKISIERPPKQLYLEKTASKCGNTLTVQENAEIEKPEELCSVNDTSHAAKSLRNDDSQLIVRVKMIDFAHVLNAEGKSDDLYIKGLENLLDFATTLLSN